MQIIGSSAQALAVLDEGVLVSASAFADKDIHSARLGSTNTRAPMKAKIMGVLAVALLAGPMGASATAFTITAAQFLPGSGYGIDNNENSATLLDVRFSTSAFSAQSFVLNAVNQSFTFNFGTIDMQEANAHSGIVPNETDDLVIAAALTFTAPTGVAQTITATGTATPGSVNDSFVDYVIDWSPVTVLFGNGGSFGISLSDMAFSSMGAQFQTATVTLLNVGDQRHTVPEPGTFAMLGLGLAGLGFGRRRKAH